MGGFSAQLECTQLDARSLKRVGILKNIFKLFWLWLRREFKNGSVKATIERYKKASDSSNTGSVAEVNAQFYQQEAEKLRNQIRNLQNTNRHMLGESVGGLPMKELKSLESRLEKGISRIRSKKNELLFAEIEYMQKKVKIVKCTVNDIPVDISFNQTAGLSALCFLEKVLSFWWMHGPGLAEFMHSDFFKLIDYLKVCILSLFCSICILLYFWCSMINAVFCLAGCIYIIDYYSFQYFNNEF
ncbi:MADS-box transcription factor 5 isoform X2 [Gossypium hirsutum]|nr:MADS-box transcription factor 5-like isoform X2 [Gossypium hirsutum]